MKKLFFFFATLLVMASCSGQLTEKVEVAYPNGQAQVVRYYNRHNNCVKEIEYYDSGQVKMEGGMKDGMMDGKWTAYFPDGRMQSIGTFIEGKRTGAATVWQENGNLYYEGFYKEGRQSGHWKWYDEQGYLLKEVDYGD
ncbi:MAG: hypothetical protein IJ057_05545 [Bacteroidales bacterium]|nr:hypothetical protein [Bacteroidales bacterium]